MERNVAAGARGTGGVWGQTGGCLWRGTLLRPGLEMHAWKEALHAGEKRYLLKDWSPGENPGQALPRNGLWPTEDSCWSRDTPWVTHTVEQKNKWKKKKRVRSKERQEGISTCLTSTSSIPSLKDLRVACGESEESGNKEHVEICSTKVKSRDEAENVFC